MHGRSSVRTPALGTLAAALLLLPACQQDTRISLEQLQRYELELVDAETPAVDPQALTLPEIKPFTLGPRDVLSIDITGLQGEYVQTQVRARVHDDGTITLPIIGELTVGGKTLVETEELIENAYVPNIVKLPLTVFVEVADPLTTTVTVVGASTQPGLVDLLRNERNVLFAVARAGGFAAALSSKVRVEPVDPTQSDREYNLADIRDVRRALSDPPLTSGDLVVIAPETISRVYVMGLVRGPGPIEVPPNAQVSVMRAIAAAGGLLDFLDPPEATLWRTLDTGKQVRVRLDLLALRDGRAPDVALRPGDLIDIPHTPETRFRAWVAENILIGPFGVTAIYDPVADYRARILSNNNNSGDGFRRSLFTSVQQGFTNLVIPPVLPPTTIVAPN